MDSNRTPSDHVAAPIADVLAGGGEMGALMRRTDWAATPLGPVEGWPQSLRTSLRILLTSRHPMFMWWGPELIQFYNDAYRPILGATKHPAIGRRGRDTWAEIWDVIGPMIEAVTVRGESTFVEDGLLVLDRYGYLEECYFTYAYSPVPDETGGFGGIFVACSESTDQILGERRLRTLRDLAARAAQGRTAEEACAAAAATLGENAADLPFALLYLVDPGGDTARLAGATGLSTGHAAAPPAVPLRTAPDAVPGATWPLWSAALGTPVVVDELATRFGALVVGPWPEPVTTALILPVSQPGSADPSAAGGRLAGFLVAGISPRRRLDESYRGFLELAAAHIAAGIADARAHEAERARTESLAELDRAKTAFFSSVSHEFRTPLTLLLGPLRDALASRPGAGPPALAGEALEQAHRNALRLERLVNALLNFSRIEAGRIQAEYEAVDLPALTADLASGFRAAVERAGLHLVVESPPLRVPDDLAEPIFADRAMWEAIVLNLLSNAFKHTFEGHIQVAVRPAAGGRQIELEVRDTGTGIPPEELPRVFERFHRVRDARARTHEGSGIGLALVQELVRLHGGAVDVTSTLGEGSSFVVRLPAGSSHLPPERVRREGAPSDTASSRTLGVAPFVEEALRWLPDTETEAPLQSDPAAGAPIQTTRPPGIAGSLPTTPVLFEDAGAPARILVADDNADMRRYVARVLGAYWTVETVPDGTAAVAAARARPPDVALLDVMMPGLDGFAVLRALREDPRTTGVPVLLLSARAGEEATVEGLAAGAHDYLVKPFAAGELVARVRTHLALARARAEAEAARRRLHDLFMQAPAFIAVVRGPDHVFELANAPYVRLVRRQSEAELIGKRVRETLPEVVDQGYIELLDRVFATGEPFIGRAMPVQLAAGRGAGDGALEEILVDFVYQPSRSSRGEIDGVIALGYDVTDQVRARERADRLARELQDQLESHAQLNVALREAAQARDRALAEAQAAVRTRDEFLSAAAHDLRSPLSSVVGHAQLLRRRASRGESIPVEPLLHALGQIEDAGSQMRRLIDDLVDIARLQAGQPLPLNRQPTDLVLLSRLAVEKHQHGAERHELRVETLLPELVGEWDAARLERVLDNLLTNAIKYSPEGGPITVAVQVEPGPGGGWATLGVTDQGIGIPQPDLTRVFERFERGSNAAAQSGSGIGLASVRQIAEQHGGTVAVESCEGHGSTFTVRLPL